MSIYITQSLDTFLFWTIPISHLNRRYSKVFLQVTHEAS